MSWSVFFINSESEREIHDLPKDLKAKFVHITDLLIQFGPLSVGMPHVRPIEGKVWEMRLKGKDKIARTLYFLETKKKIVILHTFIKKTQKTPQKAIDIAHKRMEEIR